MSRGKSQFRKNAKTLARIREKSSNKCILIVTEGKNTEPNYLKALRKKLGLKAADIEVVHPEGTDPVTLTQAAIALFKKRQKQQLKAPYDEVWVVFDLEKTHDERRAKAKEARNLNGAKGIRFAESDPSFEFWRLLHETYTAKSFDSCEAVTKELKEKCPEYTKSENPSAETLNKIPFAVANAQRLRKDSEQSGRTTPATTVDLLVRTMNEATRRDLQLPLQKS